MGIGASKEKHAQKSLGESKDLSFAPINYASGSSSAFQASKAPISPLQDARPQVVVPPHFEQSPEKAASKSKASSLTNVSPLEEAAPSPKAFSPWSAKDSTKFKDKSVVSSNASALPVYEIPKHMKEMIEKDEVPDILKTPLSKLNYSNYFACLLYAEDFYQEKWSEYILSDVTIQMHKRQPGDKTRKNKNAAKGSQQTRDFVAFKIDSVPERRPYLVSRDFVNLRLLGGKPKNFQGYFVCVINGSTLLAEFKDEFHSQHSPAKKYDVSFSFNRVCLKRAHHAVAAALSPLLFDFLFPTSISRTILSLPTTTVFPSDRYLDHEETSSVHQILKIKGPPPYLIDGPLSLHWDDSRKSEGLSKTAVIIREAIIRLFKTRLDSRILICTPKNTTSDKLIHSLYEDIPGSLCFRANAAFRDYDAVPDDIRDSCTYNTTKECFTCPPLSSLLSFKVISSTYMSSFRLSNAGIKAGHFTHIFLVDASSVTEPEAVVPLANLADEDTAVVISGSSSDLPRYIHSDVARRNGLKTSYFGRLLGRWPYMDDNPAFICRFS